MKIFRQLGSVLRSRAKLIPDDPIAGATPPGATAILPTATLATRLQGAAAVLAEIARNTDPDFLKLGGDLKALHACAQELNNSTSGSVGLVRAALLNSHLTEDGGLAARSLQGLKTGLTEVAYDLESLRGVITALESLRGQARRMEQLARLIRTSGSIFAIESSRSTACCEAFGAFIHELRQVGDKIGALGEVIGDQSGTIHEQVSQISGTIHDDLSELGKLVEHSEQAVRQTAARVHQLQDSSWTALQEAEKRAREIARYAGEAVYYLQFGDIVRQKLEHVSAALLEAASLAQNGANHDAKVSGLLIIQAGQLEVIQAEIVSARTQLAEAFAGMGAETDRLVATVGQLSGEGGQASTQEKPFEMLKIDLTRLQSWQAEGRRLCMEAEKMSEHAVDSSGRLSQYLGQIQTINREMHLQALNAIIKAVLLGDEGQTLGVLSTHVHQISEQSNHLVAETVKLLGEVQTQASRTNESKRSALQRDGELRAGMEKIFQVQNQFEESAVAAVALAEKQHKQVEVAQERLKFLAGLEASIKSIWTESGAIRSDFGLSDQLPATQGGPELAERYTMESEREVHRRLSKPGAITTPVVAAAPAPAAVDDSNMDFFDAPAAPPELDSQSASAVIATIPPLPEVVAELPEKKTEDLGANFEMF